jgi:catechol 2,3-dioxygenase-like lactoylglutathione lyase family enzyme
MVRAVDTYPLASFPTLAVPDPAAAARWYRRALGFSTVHERPGLNGTPVLVHLRRDRHQDLMLEAGSGAHGPGGAAGVTLTFWVDDDLDALARRARAAGAGLVDGPVVRPWGAELIVVDPDGYRLVFGRG